MDNEGLLPGELDKLLKKRGFRVVPGEPITWGSDAFRVQCDAKHDFGLIQVAPNHDPEDWHGLILFALLLDGADLGVRWRVRDALSFLDRRFDAIAEALTPQKLPDLKPKLLELGRQRIERFLGKPEGPPP